MPALTFRAERSALYRRLTRRGAPTVDEAMQALAGLGLSEEQQLLLAVMAAEGFRSGVLAADLQAHPRLQRVNVPAVLDALAADGLLEKGAYGGATAYLPVGVATRRGLAAERDRGRAFEAAMTRLDGAGLTDAEQRAMAAIRSGSRSGVPAERGHLLVASAVLPTGVDAGAALRGLIRKGFLTRAVKDGGIFLVLPEHMDGVRRGGVPAAMAPSGRRLGARSHRR